MKMGFLFPGQGAQTVGMGSDIYDEYPEAREVYKIAQEITGIDVKNLCFEGPEEKIMKTENAQLAVLTTSLAIERVLSRNNIKAQVATGLSLGEYSALVYGGYLSLEECFKLIQKRGYYMGNFLPNEEYSMAAVIGIDSNLICKVCEQIKSTGKFVVPANFNCKMQTVISGTKEGIEEAINKLKEAGAKRIVPLKTSGPFHTEKLSKAKELYEQELIKAKFLKGNGVTVVKNIDGRPYSNSDNMPIILSKHIVSTVRFDKTIEYMREQEITDFVEIGPGKSLSGFVKKDYPEANIYNINDLKSLQNFIDNNK